MKKLSFEERKKQCEMIMKMCKNKIPIVINKNPKFPNLKNVIKTKYLIDKDMTIKNFLDYLGKHCLQLELKKPDLILDIKLYSSSYNNIEINKEGNISSIYEKYKDEDGYLYINYSYEYIKNSKENNNSVNNSDFQDKIPIILEKDPKYPYIKSITKSKFLAPKIYSVLQFSFTIKKNYLNLNESIDDLKLNFILTTKSDNEPLEPNDNIVKIYEKYKDKKDEYLYLYYSYEYSFKYSYKQISLENRKLEFEQLSKIYKGKLPVIVEKNPNYPNIKNIKNKKLLYDKDNTISDIINMIKKNLELEQIMNNKKLNFIVMETINYLSLSENDNVLEVYNKYKEEEGFLYLQYIYEYNQINDLQIFKPKYKYNNNLEVRKDNSNKCLSKKMISVIIEKYPDSKLENIDKKFCVDNKYNLYQIKEKIEKQILINKKENIKFYLITENNIDLRYQEQINIKEIYSKYKDEDGSLYLYYIENELLPESTFNSTELFNFKKYYTLEERKMKYKELKKKHPKKILIIVEKEFDLYENNELNNKEEKIDEILFFNPNTEIDSLKIKIWENIGKPFTCIEFFDKNKKIVQNYSKIIDLYNNYKDDEDEFVYLFYTCIKPKIDKKDNQNFESMTDAKKIFLLFKRIPFIFSPSTSFGNANTLTKVFLPYKPKDTFNEIQTNNKYKYKYYIDYPNKILDLNQNMVDFYLKNKKEDDFLYLIIDKE